MKLVKIDDTNYINVDHIINVRQIQLGEPKTVVYFTDRSDIIINLPLKQAVDLLNDKPVIL